MINYVLKKNNNQTSKTFGKYYAHPVVGEMVDLEQLAEHLASHNSPFSRGMIKGLLTDMVVCIKELLLEGKNVKIDNLAIFSIGIKNAKGGSDKEEDFTVQKNIDGVRLRARATGTLIAKSLGLDASLKRANALPATSSTSGNNTGTGSQDSGDERP